MTKNSKRVIVIDNPEFTVHTELGTNTTQKTKFVKKEGTIPNRLNNPLSITCGASQKELVEQELARFLPVEDGRCFMWYLDTKTGFEAAKKLLLGPNYALHSVEKAMRKWSGSGYGNEFGIRDVQIKDLTEEEIDDLINKMAKREGYKL